MTLVRPANLNYGEVEKEITSRQPGRIKFKGTYWKATLAASNCRSIASGERAKIVGAKGIGLLVVPEDYEFPAPART